MATEVGYIIVDLAFGPSPCVLSLPLHHIRCPSASEVRLGFLGTAVSKYQDTSVHRPITKRYACDNIQEELTGYRSTIFTPRRDAPEAQALRSRSHFSRMVWPCACRRIAADGSLPFTNLLAMYIYTSKHLVAIHIISLSISSSKHMLSSCEPISPLHRPYSVPGTTPTRSPLTSP